MNLEQLKQGQQLAEIIKRTEEGLAKLKELQYKRKEETKRDNVFDDGQYNLFIGPHRDGSGSAAELSRYMGNAELLDIIVNALENQLANFKSQFEEL